ncbi:MAG: SAM hydrolase/SAM-dependent halogenase family protein [Luteibaculaceae bacterium]
MAIITLTTDLGNKDYYVPAIKGIILQQSPDANIIDISNDVPSFDILKAAFLFKNSFVHFPKGTIHILSVDPDNTGLYPHILLVHQGHFIIGNDNGIFSLIFEKEPEKVFELTFMVEPLDLKFPSRYFARAAAHLANGGTPELIGKPAKITNRKDSIGVKIVGDTLQGTIIYIDKYGNLVTNISEVAFQLHRRNRSYKVFFRGNEEGLNRISASISVAKRGDFVCLFGPSGNLEIAINQGAADFGGSASSLLGLGIMDTVRIEFNA